jgi:hypothetical protein
MPLSSIFGFENIMLFVPLQVAHHKILESIDAAHTCHAEIFSDEITICFHALFGILSHQPSFSDTRGAHQQNITLTLQ